MTIYTFVPLFYGRSNVKSHTLDCKIENIHGTTLDVDMELPPHFVKYCNGVIIIKRSHNAVISEPMLLSQKRTKVSFVQEFKFEADCLDIILKVTSCLSRRKVKFETTTIFRERTKLFNLSIAVESAHALTHAFLKIEKFSC